MGQQSLARVCLVVLLGSLLLWLGSFLLCAVAEASGPVVSSGLCSQPQETTPSQGTPGAASGLAGCRAPAEPVLLVVGFMGGRVRPGNLVHAEATLARDLQAEHPHSLRAWVFANHDAPAALRAVLQALDTDRDGRLSVEEKRRARVVLYGHSWGASEAIAMANRLDILGIPVLLTAQVDSVRKTGEDDALIPANVVSAVNFYQAEGWLRGRAVIHAANARKTALLGDHTSFYAHQPVSCAGYPWFARTFMKEHIEIENDPRVWKQIKALVESLVINPREVKASGTTPPPTASDSPVSHAPVPNGPASHAPVDEENAQASPRRHP